MQANVIGSGPNGLAAAITLAQAGVEVTVYEGRNHVGGACSSAELTLPGFVHDVGSSAYPMGFASPFFSIARPGAIRPALDPAGGRVGAPVRRRPRCGHCARL